VESFVSLYKDIFVGQPGGHQLIQAVSRHLGPITAGGDLFAHVLIYQKVKFRKMIFFKCFRATAKIKTTN